MPSDDERDSKATKLKDREGFLSWKRTMRLVAMDNDESDAQLAFTNMITHAKEPNVEMT